MRGYTQVPASVWDLKLPPIPRVVLFYLIFRFNRTKQTHPRVSIARIAADCQCSRRSVTKALTYLESHAHIARQAKGPGVTVYEIAAHLVPGNGESHAPGARGDARGARHGAHEVRTEPDDVNQMKEPSPPAPPRGERLVGTEIVKKWNQIAALNDLGSITRCNGQRLKKLKARLAEDPKFWSTVEAKVATRKTWARENRFPSFDQVLQASTYQKLSEGFYDGPAAGAGEESFFTRLRRNFDEKEAGNGFSQGHR